MMLLLERAISELFTVRPPFTTSVTFVTDAEEKEEDQK